MYRRYVKRIIDVILSLVGLILASWLYLLIMIAIEIDDPGPVFFSQKRVGIHKKYFQLYKFRSMKMSTPHDMPTHLLENPEQYITRVGKFLRKTSLDEIPQLWNILRGDMSVIGPRPALWNQEDLLALVFISLLGFGKYNVILALGVAFVPSYARVIRSEFARHREMNYVKSARLMGAGHLRIMFLHILPNTRQVLLPTLVIGFNNAVLAEASMSYLGIGVKPPDVSLGYMLSESQSYMARAPWYMLTVGGVIVLLILGVSLLGEGLQQKEWGR